MTDEMEKCIREISRSLNKISNQLDTDVSQLLKQIVSEGVKISKSENLKTVTEVSCGGNVVCYQESDGGSNLSSRHTDLEQAHTEEWFKNRYFVGDLIVPDNLDELPSLCSVPKKFVAPKTIPVMDYCVWPHDQGDNPWCAACASAGFASNVLWRKNGYPEVFNPVPIYEYAKSIDGNPNSKGTSLDASMKGLIHLNYFDGKICNVKVIRSIEQVKYAIHKFGCCLIGLNISKEWYHCNIESEIITGKKYREQIGGHAVLCCGYDRIGIIIQNSWGEEWGNHGFAHIAWDELEREFLYGAVIDNCLYETRMN